MQEAVKAVMAVDGVPRRSSRAGNSQTRRALQVAADRVKEGRRQTLLSNRLASQPLVGERWAMGSAVVLGQSNGRPLLQLQRRRNDGPRHRRPPRQGRPIHLTMFDNVYTIKWVQCLNFCKNSATLVISVAVFVEHVVNFVDDIFVNANKRLSAHKLGNQSDW